MENLNSDRANPVYDAENKEFGKYPCFTFEDDTYPLQRIHSFEFLVKGFPFERMEYKEGVFFLSEPNLLRTFNPYRRSEFKIDGYIGDETEYFEGLKSLFYSGYKDGMQMFKVELGISYDSLQLHQKLDYLAIYINRLRKKFYFSGFAGPTVLRKLGYIQANLFMAVQEYRAISPLLEKEQNKASGKQASEKNQFIKKDGLNKEAKKIKITGESEKIFTLWKLVLLDWSGANFEVSYNIKTEEELKIFLGCFFDSPDFFVSESSKDVLERLLLIERENKNLILIDFLIHATHFLNKEKLTIKQYCLPFWENINGYRERFPAGVASMATKINNSYKEVLKKLLKLVDHPTVAANIKNLQENDTYRLKKMI